MTMFIVNIMIIGVFHQYTTVTAQNSSIGRGTEDAIDLPQIEWSADEIVLGYRDTWNVTCKCHKPIVWKPFDSQYEWDPPDVTVSIYNTKDFNQPYGSMLTIRNASALMVGRYYCVHSEKRLEDLDEMLAENVASSIYVFVEDPYQLVIPDPVKYYSNIEGVIVLCKPSYPEVYLELCDKISKECTATPDPTKGILIPDNLNSDSTEFYCKVNGMSYTAYDGGSINDGLLKPTIISNVGDIVPIGKTARLTCSFEVPSDMKILISWKTLPNYQSAETDNTISVGKQTKYDSHFSSTLILKRELVIRNTTLAHQRTYRCESIDNKNNTYYHNFRLKVRETPDDFVILREAQNRTIIHRRVNRNGEILPIEIIIHYKSYPALSNVKSYEWSREDAAMIVSNDYYKHSVTADYINLRINQPTIQDSDIYSLEVQAGTSKAIYNISIFVHDKPSLSMHNIMAVKGEAVNFLCGSVAYPSPEMWFFFQPCNEVPWGNCSMVVDTETEWQEGTQEMKSLIWSTVSYNQIADEPGTVYCKANNSEGNAMVQAYLLLENVSDSMTLEIVQPKGLITVGDNVTFVCSTFNTVTHTVDVVFEHDGREDEGIVLHEESLIHKVQFTLFNVSLNHTGDIYCHVIFRDNDKPSEKRSIHMEVIAPMAPYLRSGEINQTLTVNVLEPLHLICDVVGAPEPMITWFKDGQPLAYIMNTPTNTTSISIRYAIPSHTGLYECIAENEKGDITITRNVIIQSTKWNQPITYVAVVFFILTIVFALTSLCSYKKMKRNSAVSNFNKPLITTSNELITPILPNDANSRDHI